MKKIKTLSAYSIILLILLALYILILFLPKLSPEITDEMIKNNNSIVNGVIKNNFSLLIMSPYKGFVDAIEINIFVLFLGGFLAIVNNTNSLTAGINNLIIRFKGKEITLIPILMTVFAIGGTTYGMCEDSLALFPIICTAMIATGFDTMVGASIFFLGAGIGVLGSTINPFSIGIAISTLKNSGIENVSIEKVMLLGLILLISSLIPAIMYVVIYAKRIRNKAINLENNMEKIEFTKKQKVTLILFSFTFIVMIIGLIPWSNYNINIFNGWSSFLLGEPIGNWYFSQLSMWFLIMGLIIGIYNKYSESEIINLFINGSKDVLPVVFIISLSRGVSILMRNTYLNIYLLNIFSNLLNGLNPVLFTALAYFLYLILSFLVPSTSGLATLSLPIMGNLTQSLGYSPEVMVLIYCSSCGVINLITPTSAFIMGGLIIAKIEYIKYFKWVIKFLIFLIFLNIFILTIAMKLF